MNTIFTGTTMECLEHLEGAIRGDDHFAKREDIAAFIGVGTPAIYRWFTKKNQPTGEPLIRLRFYLEFNGYDVSELQGLHPAIRDAARTYAFQLISLEEIAETVGYSAGRKGLDCVLRVFRGLTGASSEKLTTFADIAALRREQLICKQNVTKKIVPEAVSQTVPALSLRLKPPTSLREALKPSVGEHEVIIQSLASLVTAMLPLAQKVGSNDYTAAEREKVRELAGGDGVFKLANELFRMCGERARAMRTQQ